MNLQNQMNKQQVVFNSTMTNSNHFFLTNNFYTMEFQEEQQTREVAIINGSIEVFKTAPQVLKANKERTKKALVVGNTIIAQWQQAWAIENEDDKLAALAAADERSNKYLVNCGTALTEEKEARAAITQMMDEFKKMFTGAENDIDKSKPNTIPAQVQTNRNDFAKVSFEISERKRKEVEKEAAKKREAIDLKATAEIRLSTYFNEYLLKAKQWLQGKFNDLKFEGFADAAADIRMYEPSYVEKHFVAFNANLFSQLHTPDELKAIQSSITENAYAGLNDKYKKEMLALKADLVDKIPSKHQEILDQKKLDDEAAAEKEKQRLANEERERQLAEANDKEKAELEKQQQIQRDAEAKKNAELKEQQDKAAADKKQREEDDAAKLQQETAQANAATEQEVAIKQQGEQTMVMFESEAAIAESVQAPEARQGYDITVQHQVGWGQIFQLWFENEGKNLAIDKIGNTKMDQMKAWCEKYAHKTGTKIESKFVVYTPSFKAVNKK
jgi:hypothetical protein